MTLQVFQQMCICLVSEKTFTLHHFLHHLDVQYPNKLHQPHIDLPLLPEEMKTQKFEKVVANLHDKNEYVIQKKKIKTSVKSQINL